MMECNDFQELGPRISVRLPFLFSRESEHTESVAIRENRTLILYFPNLISNADPSKRRSSESISDR